MYATWSRLDSASMTRPPIISLGMSVSPELSSWRTSELIIRSTRSGSTGRLRSAMCIERASLSRSKGSRCPCFFMTVSSRSCTRSKVVKRAAQFGQKRRRRIAPRSSVGRESFTWVSSAPQNGQRIPPSLFHWPARPVLLVLGAGFVIDRETGTEFAHICAHSYLSYGVTRRLQCQCAQHLDDVPRDSAKLVRTETACRRRGRAEPNPGSHRRLLRVERNAVLVAGDAGTLETRLGVLPGHTERPQIDQHQMRVGAAGNDFEPRLGEGRRQDLGVRDDGASVGLECRLQCLVQRDGLGSDYMHQRSAL